MKTLIIYHGHCYDGFTAAWVAWKYFNEYEDKLEVDFHAAEYQSEPPNVKEKDVFIVDFSYPRKTLKAMHLEANTLLVLDHHKSAKADLEGLDYAIFDMEQSGCGLTWNWFFAGKSRPKMLDRIEDHDLWRFKFDDTKAAQAYAGTVPMTFHDWDTLMDDECFFNYLEKGEAVLKYIAMYGKKCIENMKMEQIANFVVPTMNMPYMNCSEHLHALLERDFEGAFVVSYFRQGDGTWKFSLRSKGDFDVSEIAKRFGGGGHRNSAGFTVDKLPW